MPCDFTYTWNLKNKTDGQTEEARNRLINTDNKLVVARGVRVGGMGEMGKGG